MLLFDLLAEIVIDRPKFFKKSPENVDTIRQINNRHHFMHTVHALLGHCGRDNTRNEGFLLGMWRAIKDIVHCETLV